MGRETACFLKSPAAGILLAEWQEGHGTEGAIAKYYFFSLSKQIFLLINTFLEDKEKF